MIYISVEGSMRS